MEETNNAKSSSTKGILAVAFVALVIGVGVFMYQNNSSSPKQATNSTVSVSEETTTSVVEMMSYKDGQYDVVGKYTSPGGEEELGVSLTLKNNIVEEVEVKVLATRPISLKMQQDFSENYKSEVVGKKISDLNLGKISGASLTPKGFNDALEQIKSQAKI